MRAGCSHHLHVCAPAHKVFWFELWPDLSLLLPTTGSPWYHVTHSGIDAMVQRLMQELDTFSKLSPANQTVEHSR